MDSAFFKIVLYGKIGHAVGACRHWGLSAKTKGNIMAEVDWAVMTKEGELAPWRDYVGQWLDSASPGSVRVYEGKSRSRQYEIRGDGFSVDAVLDRIEEESLPVPVSRSEQQLSLQSYAAPDCRGKSESRTLVFAHPGSSTADALMAEARGETRQPDADLGAVRAAMVSGSEVVATLDVVRLMEGMQAYHSRSIIAVQDAQDRAFRLMLTWHDELVQRSRAALGLLFESAQSSGDREIQRVLAERQIEAEQQQRTAELAARWKERLVVGGLQIAETAVKSGVLSPRGAENLAGAIAGGLRAAAPSGLDD